MRQMSRELQKRHDMMKDAFLQFYRNGRWGTCGDCPRDSDGKAYPEFCSSTTRHDHQLNAEGLASCHNSYTKDAKNE